MASETEISQLKVTLKEEILSMHPLMMNIPLIEESLSEPCKYFDNRKNSFYFKHIINFSIKQVQESRCGNRRQSRNRC